MYDEQEGNEFKLGLIFLTNFERQIEEKYIEIFKILKKMKQNAEFGFFTEPSSQILDELHQEYTQAYSELNKLLDKVSQIAKDHNPDAMKDQGDLPNPEPS